MKLISPNYETTLLEVRLLSEHATLRPAPRVLCCRDHQPTELRAITPSETHLDNLKLQALTAGRSEYRRVLGRTLNITQALDLFRQSQPGDFTTRDAVAFMSEVGWTQGIHAVSNTGAKLRQMVATGEVVEVCRGNQNNGRGILCVWRFAT